MFFKRVPNFLESEKKEHTPPKMLESNSHVFGTPVPQFGEWHRIYFSRKGHGTGMIDLCTKIPSASLYNWSMPKMILFLFDRCFLFPL